MFRLAEASTKDTGTLFYNRGISEMHTSNLEVDGKKPSVVPRTGI